MNNQETPGLQPLNEILHTTRVQRGLSLEAISDQLNLSLEQIKQMESVEFDPALLTPFERGYVRNYAAILGIDKSIYQPYFPDVIGVSSELLSTKRFNYPAKEYLIGNRFSRLLKWLAWLVALIIVLWVGIALWPGLLDVDQVVDSLQVEQLLPMQRE
jgi:cytoskeleton protein RodZ